MNTTNVTVRMDENVKKEFESVLSGVGLNMTSAITAFAKAVIRQDGIPFELTNRRRKDDYFTHANMAAIRRSMKQFEDGDMYTFQNMEELEKFVRGKTSRAN